MPYREVGDLEQIWYIIRYQIRSYREWKRAKRWAMVVHPGWVYIASRAKTESVRETYRKLILDGYRRYGNGKG